MYKISVPITVRVIRNYGTEPIIKSLKDVGAKRVFICPGGEKGFWESVDEELEFIKDIVPTFKENGFETGIWVWTFQYPNGDFTYMRDSNGKSSATSVCPLDKSYQKLMGYFVEKAAKTGVDLFMFDDDFRYTFIDAGICCLCDNHIKKISEDLGETVTLEIMRKKILYGEKNKYRSAFLKANREGLLQFAKEMRRRADAVAPKMRMGFCSCISQWDIDALHPDILSKTLAGNTKPFYRLIGAPYWAKDKNWGNRLQDVIELERMEAARRQDKEIEMFSECDTYPRPRFQTPASFAEGFDTALRAAGCMDGILKYMLDYTASPAVETGYVKRHILNKPIYEQIDKMFSDKKAVGIRVYDKWAKLEDLTIPKCREGSDSVQDIAFNVSSRFVANTSLPSVYEGEGYCGVAFGDDIKKALSEGIKSGLIIDLAAAEILQNNGIDTGIVEMGDALTAQEEIYTEYKTGVGLLGNVRFREVKLNSNAKIESVFRNGEKRYPASYRYTNENGDKFLVLCLEAYFNSDLFYRQYPKAHQVIDVCEFLGGQKLPAIITDNPDLYVIMKRNEKAVAIGLWNFSADAVEEPKIAVSFGCKNLNTINCSAVMGDKEVKLSRLEPYGFAAVEIEY